MERVESFNTARLLWCCDDLGIDVPSLSLELKISPKTFDKLLDGEDVLTFGQLQKIADYFGRSILFFLEPGDVNETRVNSVQYRTLQNQKPTITPKLKKLIRAIESQREVLIELIEGNEDAPKTEFPQLDQLRTLGQKAYAIRQWLGLEVGKRYTFDDYRHAIESKGFFVFVSNGFNGSWQIDKNSPIRGFALYYDYYPVISVKKADKKSGQSFTLMHELAHLVLHKDSFIDDENDLFWSKGKEREANDLAGRILIPDECLDQIDFSEFPEDNVTEFKAFFEPVSKRLGVSTESVIVRTVKSGKLDFGQYGLYKNMVSNFSSESDAMPRKIPRTYRHREPVNMFGVPYVSAVINALQDKEISLSRASKYLDGIQINDIKKLENHLLCM